MEEKDLVAYQDNSLVEASYKLSLNEKRLLMLLFAKVDPEKQWERDKAVWFELSVSDWRRAFGNTSNKLRQDIDTACHRIMDRPALHLTNTKGDTVRANMVSIAELPAKGRAIRLKIDYDMLTLFSDQLAQFTRVDLFNIQHLRSFYSIRVYELLSRWRDTGMRVDTLDALRTKIDPDGKYPRWQDLRRFVLDKACKDINEHTNLRVAYAAEKQGRRIARVRFTITDRPAGLWQVFMSPAIPGGDPIAIEYPTKDKRHAQQQLADWRAKDPDLDFELRAVA